MSRRSRPAGAGRIATFQLLWHRVDLEVDAGVGAGDRELLTYTDNDAEHDLRPVASMHYRVVAGDGALTVDEDDLTLVTGVDARRALDVLYRRMHQRAFELASLRGWVRLHAAVVDLEAARVLVVAPSGVGKTTMSCRLLLDGIAVAADESVVVRAGMAVPVARRLHVKPGTLDVLPAVAPLVAASPSIEDGAITAVPPSAFGPWRVTPRPVHHVVLLERGERPLTAMGTAEALADLLPQVMGNQESVADAVREVAVLLREARCWRLGHRPLVGRAAELVGIPDYG